MALRADGAAPIKGREFTSGVERKKADPKEFLAKMLEVAGKKKEESVESEAGKKKIDSQQHIEERFFNPTKEVDKKLELSGSQNKIKNSRFKEYLMQNASRPRGLSENLHAHKPPKDERKSNFGFDEFVTQKLGDELADSGIL